MRWSTPGRFWRNLSQTLTLKVTIDSLIYYVWIFSLTISGILVICLFFISIILVFVTFLGSLFYLSKPIYVLVLIVGAFSVLGEFHSASLAYSFCWAVGSSCIVKRRISSSFLKTSASSLWLYSYNI